MTATTVETLLSSAPPGQIESLVKHLSTLTTVPLDLIEKAKANTAVSAEISKTHPLAAALQLAFQVYQQEYYSQVDYTFSITDDLKLTTYAERIDTKNFYAGSWRGDWQIHMVDNASATLQGSIRIHVYYHEDCNVQLETSKLYNDTIPITSDTDVAKSIQTKIATIESDLASELEEMYHSMDDKLKALRRVLPIMRTRLEWNVLAHRMVKKLEESSQSTNRATDSAEVV